MRRMWCGKGPVGALYGLIVAFISLMLIVLILALFSTRPHYDPAIRQKAQLNAINAAIELFRNEFEDYPPSDANDVAGVPYCGAMKLTEAMMGRDLLGFHSDSLFRRDGLDKAGVLDLYPDNIDTMDPALRNNNLTARRGPYLPAASASVYRLADIYGYGNTGPFPEDTFVLCDTYDWHRSGKRTGMPILYYRADLSGTAHDIDNPDNPENIYRYMDNQALLALGVLGEANKVHPLADPAHFYRFIQSSRNKKKAEPYRRDTFILISAGEDGLYGTKDDICNFER